MFKVSVLTKGGNVILNEDGDYSGFGRVIFGDPGYQLAISSDDAKRLSEGFAALSKVLKIKPPKPKPFQHHGMRKS